MYTVIIPVMIINPLIMNAQKKPNWSMGYKTLNETLTRLSMIPSDPIMNKIKPTIKATVLKLILNFLQN